MENDQHKVILYDDSCKLCIRTVDFINRHDRLKQFSFMPLGSDEARQLMQTIKPSAGKFEPESVNLIDNNKRYTKSAAVIRILFFLKNRWKPVILLLAVPRFIRDALYDLIAANRHRWFGK